jgi:hypothetical protein
MDRLRDGAEAAQVIIVQAAAVGRRTTGALGAAAAAGGSTRADGIRGWWGGDAIGRIARTGTTHLLSADRKKKAKRGERFLFFLLQEINEGKNVFSEMFDVFTPSLPHGEVRAYCLPRALQTETQKNMLNFPSDKPRFPISSPIESRRDLRT